MSDFLTSLSLMLPLVVSGIVHMIFVKLNFVSFLVKPINEKLFGYNKTWRGFVLMPILTVFCIYIQEMTYGKFLLAHGSAFSFLNFGILYSGTVLGFAYILAELPNSYIKRKLHIVPGEESEKFRWTFRIIDQADSVFGCALAAYLLLGISAQVAVLCLLIGTLVHLAFNHLLYRLKIRKNPF